MRLYIYFLILLFSFSISYSQTFRIDSLKKELHQASGSKQLDVAIKICKERNSMSGDSLLKYVMIADSLNKTINDKTAYYNINYYKIGYVQVSGNLDSAITICDSFIIKLEKEKDKSLKELLHRFQTYKGALLIRNNKVKEAIALLFDALKDSESDNDSINIFAAMNSIGWANMEISNYTEAIVWLKKAADLTDKTVYAVYPLCNLASSYNNSGKNDSALMYVDMAIAKGILAQELKGLANAYAIKSAVLTETKNMNGAEEMMKKSMEIRRQIGDQFYVVSDMYQLGMFYANTEQCEKGINICNEALAIAAKYKFAAKRIILYEALGQNYKACKRFAEYAEVLSTLISLKDSLYQVNSAEVLAEMQTKYEVENKEKIIIKQEYDLTKRNYQFYGSVIVFILAVVIAFLVFNQYRHKQRTIALQEISNAKENERKRIAAELHDNIGTQLTYISRKIELIKSNNNAGDIKDHHFLSDIMSSSRKAISDLRETIWALKKEEINIRDLADRLKVFATKQLSNHPDINLVINESLDYPVNFSSVESLNIFRILQEGFYNAIQHSEAKEIQLKFESSPEQWSVSIIDNGKGFDTTSEYDDHFGIENMTVRAKEIAAFLRITSTPGKGTSIILSNRKA